MIRSILGVIVAYIVMFVLTFAAFSALHLGLGTEKVFEPASYTASKLFLVCAVGISAVIALVGGFVCAAISRNQTAPKVLAGLILVFGLVLAVMNLSVPDPGPRTGDVTPFEAAQKARQPNWYSFTLPIVGCVGTLVGARWKKTGARVP